MTKDAYQKLSLLLLPSLALIYFSAATSLSVTQEQLQVCGDPTATCSTSLPFESYDLPFAVKGKPEFREYRSGLFYAVVLKSVKAEKGEGDCVFIAEEERLEVQRLLPKNKVFASRMVCPESQILYDGVNSDYNILAVYGGATKSEAVKVLREVKSRYPDANIRRMRVIKSIT